MSISTWSPRWRSRYSNNATWHSRRPREQRAQADQVVRRGREGDHPIDAFAAAMPELAQPAHGLQPAEDLLDQLPLLLADRVTGMMTGPIVDGAAGGLLRDMRRDPQRPHPRDE